MFLNKNFEYGIEILKSLHEAQGNVVKLETIANEKDLSIHLLEQVARKMRIASLLKSVRGPNGGYLKTSRTISARQLYDVLGSKLKNDNPSIKELEAKMLQVLSETTLFNS